MSRPPRKGTFLSELQVLALSRQTTMLLTLFVSSRNIYMGRYQEKRSVISSYKGNMHNSVRRPCQGYTNRHIKLAWFHLLHASLPIPLLMAPKTPMIRYISELHNMFISTKAPGKHEQVLLPLPQRPELGHLTKLPTRAVK